MRGPKEYDREQLNAIRQDDIAENYKTIRKRRAPDTTNLQIKTKRPPIYFLEWSDIFLLWQT